MGVCGVEGAVVVSARAKNKRDGPRRTGDFRSWHRNISLVALLSLGVLARPELAEMRNPSITRSDGENDGAVGRVLLQQRD